MKKVVLSSVALKNTAKTQERILENLQNMLKKVHVYIKDHLNFQVNQNSQDINGLKRVAIACPLVIG